MRVNFDVKGYLRRLRSAKWSDPRVIVRVVLGVLLVANLAAAALLLRPWEGFGQEGEARLAALQRQATEQESTVSRLRTLVEKSAKARLEGEAFLKERFLDRRTASSTIVSELKQAAEQSKVTPRDHTFSYEAIEGSDELSMMSISGNYEGTYADLVRFINSLDRSPRFLILDTLTAAPERTGDKLTMNFTMTAFVRNSYEEPVEVVTEESAQPAEEAETE